ILKRYRAHLGIDYAAPTGTPVKSAGKGVVTFIGTKGGYGNVIQIKHDSGYMTLYAHLSRFAKIKNGQKVNQGQVIAYVGSTGMSTGPHLHFGVYLNNKAINPASVVKIAKSELSGKAKENFKHIIAGYEQVVKEALV
ncbi:M23 family metallopeptidase, partial [Escherichia coli]|nr:M23 family metallopeptidase [Escherichia coli]